MFIKKTSNVYETCFSHLTCWKQKGIARTPTPIILLAKVIDWPVVPMFGNVFFYLVNLKWFEKSNQSLYT